MDKVFDELDNAQRATTTAIERLKRMVKLHIYVMNADLTLICVTADWCEPCGRVKPCISSMEERGELGRKVLVHERPLMGLGHKIPYCYVEINGKRVGDIQTSKEDELRAWIAQMKETKIDVTEDTMDF
jgi:hypothetical protein